MIDYTKRKTINVNHPRRKPIQDAAKPDSDGIVRLKRGQAVTIGRTK